MFHAIISNTISSFINDYYYYYLQIIYKTPINNVLNFNNFIIIKPQYFIYFQYYFIYLFFYYTNINNLLYYSISLQFINISSLIYDKLSNQIINYNPINNIDFIKNSSYILFLYLLYLKIYFIENNLKKILLFIFISSFYFLVNIQFIYNERLKYIQLKKDFRHPLKILIISPSKSFIENIVKKTKYFTYENFFITINLLLFIFNL